MTTAEITLPAMGEGITEASITKILRKEGEFVEIDDVLIEIATDKVDSEIVSTHQGTIEKILFSEGDLVKIGETILLIITDESDSNTHVEPNFKTEEIKETPIFSNTHTIQSEKSPELNNILYSSKTTSGKILSPLVRAIAKKENLNIEELELIKGTGSNKRITKSDILEYIRQKKGKSSSVIHQNKLNTIEDNFELIEMDRMRKLIAEHMTESVKTSPHVTSFIEVDVTEIVKWREKIKDEYQKKYNEKITYTPIFIESIAQILKEFPIINSSVEGTTIILKKEINIGIATALADGNLIVPVIKKASELNLHGLTKKVNDLVERARNNKLKPDEIKGGTFTLTNLGSFGNITGTPIINQPEVAILAIGTIKKKPAVIETPKGDTIGIRHLMIMSMSYDHRIVDGAMGGLFLKKVAEEMENFDVNRIL